MQIQENYSANALKISALRNTKINRKYFQKFYNDVSWFVEEDIFCLEIISLKKCFDKNYEYKEFQHPKIKITFLQIVKDSCFPRERI